MELAYNFKHSIEHSETTIVAWQDACIVANIKCNTSILKSLASAALFCGRQCIALRGDMEKIEAPGNPGNFLALLKLLAIHDDVLRDHLQTPALRNATYKNTK